MTAAVLNTKIGEVENKILDHAKYIATFEFGKSAGSIFHRNLKQTNLAKNSNNNTCFTMCWQK